MPKIIFMRKDGTTKEVEAHKNFSVMQAAVDNGITEIEALCGGAMSCATCHVYIHPDWVAKVAVKNEKSEEEEDMLDMAFDVRETSRLSCQIGVSDALDGLVVAVPGTKTDW